VDTGLAASKRCWFHPLSSASRAWWAVNAMPCHAMPCHAPKNHPISHSQACMCLSLATAVSSFGNDTEKSAGGAVLDEGRGGAARNETRASFVHKTDTHPTTHHPTHQDRQKLRSKGEEKMLSVVGESAIGRPSPRSRSLSCAHTVSMDRSKMCVVWFTASCS